MAEAEADAEAIGDSPPGVLPSPGTQAALSAQASLDTQDSPSTQHSPMTEQGMTGMDTPLHCP
jgi:hypothetical protein